MRALSAVREQRGVDLKGKRGGKGGRKGDRDRTTFASGSISVSPRIPPER